MKIFDFHNEFPDEMSCIKYLKELRESEGIVCNNCGSNEHIWLENRKTWQCKKCYSRKSLKSGTIMENTKLPLLIWFRTIALISMTKKGISTLALQKQLGLKRYEPVWEMVHKIRNSMGKRDDDYWLDGTIEIDEGFFNACEHKTKFEIIIGEEKNTKQEEKKKNKRGRGSEKKEAVLVMIQTEPVEIPKKDKKMSKIKYIKFKQIERQDQETILPILKNNISLNSTLKTDGYASYQNISNQFEKHQVTITKDKKLIESNFPWVHTMISNAKRLFLGIHHKIGKGYLQMYLNEFCYKFNRRYNLDNLIYSIIRACINSPHYSLYTLRSCG